MCHVMNGDRFVHLDAALNGSTDKHCLHSLVILNQRRARKPLVVTFGGDMKPQTGLEPEPPHMPVWPAWGVLPLYECGEAWSGLSPIVTPP